MFLRHSSANTQALRELVEAHDAVRSIEVSRHTGSLLFADERGGMFADNVYIREVPVGGWLAMYTDGSIEDFEGDPTAT